MRRAVVVALDSNSVSSALGSALSSCNYETDYAGSDTELVHLIDKVSPDLVVVAAGGEPELRLADIVRQIDRSCALLMLAHAVTKDLAMGALRAGVSDLVEEAASEQELVSAIRKCSLLATQSVARSQYPPGMEGGERMAGHSPAIQEIRKQLVQVAASDANILITGESGTGKELAATLIHSNSRRSSKPFVSLNCAAIPDTLLESELFGHERGAFTGAHATREGKLQHASGGTLFLDEVGDMSLLSQAKILRAIETRVIQRLGSNVETPIQVRLIAATNQDLEQMANEKRFRQDLYFRLNVVRLHLPPLRERSEDIPELAEHILEDLTQQHHSPVRRLQGDVLRRLQMHDWPGNIRELRNVIESIIVFSSSRTVGISDVPTHIRQRLRTTVPALQNTERAEIIHALNSTEWNRGKAAKILHWSRMTLYRKMVKHHISMKQA